MPLTKVIPRVGRRQFLFGSAAVITALSTPQLLPAAAPSAAEGAFLDVSRLLVNHELNPALGARIAAFAAASHPDLDDLLAQISDAAAARNATQVEEFFEDLPEGPARDLAYWIIQSWYTGSSSFERDASLFTYEEALMYQPTLDMVAIPSFGYSAPNGWGRDLFPLENLPQF